MAEKAQAGEEEVVVRTPVEAAVEEVEAQRTSGHPQTIA